MKLRIVMAAIASAAIVSASLVAADVKLEGVKCVVNPKAAAKPGTGVAYKGGEVYFCCKNCPKAFEKDTAKFSTRANQQLVATKQAKQEKCPISGAPCKTEHAVSVDGTEVYFCCPNCKGKVEKADDKASLVFSDEAFEKAYKVEKKSEK